MDSYTSLLERTRVPQPSLQRFAVISIFEKIRSAPPHLNADSDAGRDAITKCLYSASSPVVDQSVRELCRLVKDSKFDFSLGLLELQSALEGCDSKFVNVFVKGLGFLVRYGFQKNPSSFRFNSSNTHPFVKVLSCRSEVQKELVQQVLLFISQNKQFGMSEVCEFLRPLLNFSVIKIPLSASLRMFVEDLIRSMASVCCSFPMEALPVIKLLVGCLKYLPVKNADSSRQMELEKVFCVLGDIVSAYVVVLRHLVGMGLLVQEAQLCGVELLQTVFSLSTDFDKNCGWVDFIVDVSVRFICVQKELGLSFMPELSAVIPSLFVTLIQLELEHEQLSVVKLLISLFKWKSENDSATSREELLFIFPVINLVSSPCKSVKQAAIDLLSMLEKLLTNSLAVPKTNLTMQGRYPTISRREDIILRLLQHLWSEDQPSLLSSCLLNLAPNDGTNLDNIHAVPKAWTSLLKEYSTSVIGRRKSSLPLSQSQIFVIEMSMLLCAIASVLVMHNKLGDSAVDLLAVVGNMDPKLGVPLLLAVLFYNKLFHREHKDIDSPSMLLKLLEMLPSLASHPVMVPLVIQTILPMLQKDVKPLLYATALRLLCRTWETNDRVFGTLQGVLHPQCFTQFMSERNICISMAASIRDVCRKNPDRGVDLILSVSACIESQDSIVQGLGFQSLSHLCEADVIDFYTAWDVISKHVLESLRNPHAASSACLLLKWGALDAEAYPEAGRQVVQILWDIGTSRQSGHGSMWAKARVSAFNALSHYEVSHFEQCLPNFKKKNLALLTSETDPEVLHTMEAFEAKIITYEHITRRRSVKEKRVAASKIEKLLDVFPRNICASGNVFGAKQLPGAALFCLPLTPKSLTKGPQNAQGLQDVHAKYEDLLVEIVSSLQLSRNILIAILSLQSLKSFMQRWMRACTTFLDAKAPSTALEKTSKAADGILKIIRRLAEESIPRSAENIALAFGALCEVLPPSVHAVKSAASKFLLDWLFLYEHEHRQWSAAISLGVISSCLHVTDHKQKFQNIEALIEVASCSRSTLVKGACGLGLGISCQGLLTSVEAARDSNLERGSCNTQEIDLVGKIVRILSQMICQFSPSSTDLQGSISMYFPPGADITDSLSTYESLDKDYDDLEEDAWGVAGLVLGLGSSIGAVYRAGAHDVVNKIKSSVISWIPHLNTEIQNSSNNGGLDMLLSVGSCLAIPMIVSFCQRVELMHDYELDHLLTGLKELISELISVKKSGVFYQSLLMASCVGAGSLLSCILNEGVHSLEVELVKDFLVLFKRSYSVPHPPLVHFGGMLGVVNALGAGAGSLVQSYRLTTSRSTYDRKDSVFIIGPLLSCPSLEPQLTLLVQDMFLVAQHSDDPTLQQYAAWAVSTLRQYLWFKEFQIVDNNSPTDAAAGKESQNFPQDSVVLELSLWLMQLNHPEAGAMSHVYTIATILRCLSRAPRLPGLDWGAIIRRCMKYESQVAKSSPHLVTDKGILREECLKLCLAHANQFDSLLNFLDELSDLSRFSTLELNLQSWILLHLSDLSKIFSGSRTEKLFVDVANFLSSLHSNKTCSTEQKSLLRIACWQGLYLCTDETSPDASEYVSNMERCMEVLFSSLPLRHSAVVREMEQVHSVEWLAAIKCLAKAHQSWLLKFLQVPEGNPDVGSGDFSEVVKKVQARARLVQCGSFPVSELARLKAYLLNIKSDGIWDVLVEIVAALQHLDTNTKKQWLVETVEISCVTTHPSTALQFLGLLCGSFSKYMPLLVVDKKTVLSDLPVTLSSLLSDTRWASVAGTVVSSLWSSTQRIYDWSTRVASGNNSSIQQPIDQSQNEDAVFLLKVLHHACLLLREYLSPEQQLMLANVVLP